MKFHALQRANGFSCHHADEMDVLAYL